MSERAARSAPYLVLLHFRQHTFPAERLTLVRSIAISTARPAPAGLLALGEGMTGTTRSSADLDERRRRLLYRAWHRGTREMDLIMGRFADAVISELTEADIDAFETLSEVPDPDLYAWLSGGRPVPAEYDLALLRGLRDFHLGGRA
jgi:antitoxin CptB